MSARPSAISTPELKFHFPHFSVSLAYKHCKGSTRRTTILIKSSLELEKLRKFEIFLKLTSNNSDYPNTVAARVLVWEIEIYTWPCWCFCHILIENNTSTNFALQLTVSSRNAKLTVTHFQSCCVLLIYRKGNSLKLILHKQIPCWAILSLSTNGLTFFHYYFRNLKDRGEWTPHSSGERRYWQSCNEELKETIVQ